jgi:hypothetical protein
MLASLIAGFASGETMLALRRAWRTAIAYALAGLAVLCGLGFLIGAFYIWAARRFGSLEAAIGFGLGFLVLGGIILFIHRITTGVRARQAARRRTTELTTLAAASALAALPTLLRGRLGVGTIIAPAIAALGYAIYRENRPKRPRRDDIGE